MFALHEQPGNADRTVLGCIEAGLMPEPLTHHILVVDDEPGVRESLGMLLMSEGYDVAMAEDGVAALLQIERMLPDLIVSDLNMPRLSGFEFLPVVRLRFPQIAIVAMSGDYQGDDVPLGVCADRFFAKGQLRAQHLLTAIQKLIHASADRL
jgi:CheY-like chemotaxis protein